MSPLFSAINQHSQKQSGQSGIVGRKNALHLIQLRWIAVIGQISTISVVHFGLHISLPMQQMLCILLLQIAFNIASLLRWHKSETIGDGELFLAMLIDVSTLTAQLYLSGGTQNPFAFLYLLHVIISAVLLDAMSTWAMIFITSLCLAGLSIYSIPLELPQAKASQAILYVQGMIICFVLNAGLLTIFITRIIQNLRTDEAQLADLRQRAAEEDHIVRMGLLASGAAHELGTPLATLSVILGDWQHMPEFGASTEIQQEMHEMQTQLNRCKSIISGILLSAGEVRSESSAKTTIKPFLHELVTEWRNSRAIETFIVENRIEQDIPIAFNTALKQMIWNVLDNAFEASPRWVKFEASCAAEVLTLIVSDAGPGFTSAMLAQFGRPYQSSKGRPGRGLGLFFVTNVARKLGGVVTAHNRHQDNAAADADADTNTTGAVLRFTLPLDAIRLIEDNGDMPNG